MDQGIITAVCGIILIIALAASYLHAKSGRASQEDDTPSVNDTMREVNEYFGTKVDAKPNSVAQSLDLGPVTMLSSMGGEKSKNPQTKKSAGHRSSKTAKRRGGAR